MAKPIIAVTGPTGFIGARFIRDAVAKGYRIRALSRAAGSLDMEDVETVPFDLADPDGPDPAGLAGCEALVHLAARIPQDQNDPAEADLCWRTNALGTLQLLRAAGIAGIGRVVHTASANAYSADVETADEQSPMFPARRAPYYLMSKIGQEVFAEHWSLTGGGSVACLRLGSVYGPEQTNGALPAIAGRLSRGERIALVNHGEFGADFVTADDVSAALMLFLGNHATGPFNIGSGSRTTLRCIVELFLEFTGRDWSLVEEAESPGADRGFPALDIARARAEGFCPTGIRRGIEAFVAGMKAR